MPWLLDTNVISELRKPRPEPRVVEFVGSRVPADLFISVVSLAELRYGTELVTDQAKRGDLVQWLSRMVRPMFEQRVLPLSEDVMLKWRLLVEEGRKVGYMHSQPDLLIAATAAIHGLIVVTRNVAGYERARVEVESPWLSAQK